MFIFSMSAFFRPYLASNSSSKIASSNVFEHSRPMLSTSGLRDLAGLALPHHRRHRRLAAHADQRDASRAPLEGLGVGQRVRRVRVAAAGRREDLVACCAATPGIAFHVVPSPSRYDDERGVDVVVLERADEDRRHEPAVLADLVEHRRRLARARHDVLVDAATARRPRAAGRRGTRRSRAPTPGSGGRPGCTTCSPSRRGCSRRGRSSSSRWNGL